MRISHKLALGVAGFTLLVSGAVYFSFEISEKELRRSVSDGLSRLMAERLDNMDRAFYTRIEAVRKYALRRDIRDAAEASNRRLSKLDDVERYVREKDREWVLSSGEGETTPFMRQILANDLSRELKGDVAFYENSNGFRVFSEMFVANRYGTLVGSSGVTSDYFQADEEWYRNAVDSADYWVGDVGYDESAASYSTDIAVAMRSDTGELLGVLKAVLEISEQIDITGRLKTVGFHQGHSSMNVYLLTEDWRVIHSTGNFRFLEAMPRRVMRQRESTGDLNYFHLGDGTSADPEKIYFHAESKGYRSYPGGWVLLVQHDDKELFSVVYRERRLAGLLLAAVLAFSLLISIYLSRSITRPLQVLSDAALEIGQGRLDPSIDVTRVDEIGQLAGSFRRMAEDLKGSMTSIAAYQRQTAALQTTGALLQQSEEQLRAIVTTAKDAVILLDDAGIIKLWNPGAEDIFQYGQTEAMGENLHRLLAPERYHEAALKALEGFRATGEGAAIGTTLELNAVRKDGEEFPIELSLSSLRKDGKWLAVGFARDISARKSAEAERERLISELQSALAEVRTLSGLLPVCANCKSIRDDKGYWSKIETFISERSGAEFTHSICPRCEEELYPELAGD